jgi:hypothetical protein
MKTMSYKIEKGIPFQKRSIYPFSDMEVGDSFEVPEADGRKVRQAASIYAVNHGIKFSCRIQKSRAIRVWRIS